MHSIHNFSLKIYYFKCLKCASDGTFVNISLYFMAHLIKALYYVSWINVKHTINVTTTDPFKNKDLIEWNCRNGIQQRRNSFEDGVSGTTCPIPPGRNFTYILQVKDQIGSFYYFPSLAFHKAAGGFGGIRILSRPRIPVPFPEPAGDYTVLIGDWYKSNHTVWFN